MEARLGEDISKDSRVKAGFEMCCFLTPPPVVNTVLLAATCANVALFGDIPLLIVIY